MTDPNILFHFKPADDLFRTPLQAEQRFDLLPDLTAEGGDRALLYVPPQRLVYGPVRAGNRPDPDSGAALD